MIALIDGDPILYSIGYVSKDLDLSLPGDPKVLEDRVSKYLYGIFSAVNASSYVGALSAKHSFRNQLYKFAKYKGTRKSADIEFKDKMDFIRNYLINEWDFYLLHDLEADDIVSWCAHTYTEDRVICSPDKDLRQIPSDIYAYNAKVKPMWYHITEEEAEKFLYIQMLTGDSTDNVKGIPGIGEVNAEKIWKKGDKVLDLYIDRFGEYYGQVIYRETLCTLMTMKPGHPIAHHFIDVLQTVHPTPLPR